MARRAVVGPVAAIQPRCTRLPVLSEYRLGPRLWACGRSTNFTRRSLLVMKPNKSRRSGPRRVGKALLFTLTAFANEPGVGGGYVLLGVAKKPDRAGPAYEIVGVSDPDKLQNDIAAHCSTDFNVTLRPQMSVSIAENKPVIVVRIHEAEPNEKPVYLKKYGLPKGACRRIGSTDQHCTDDDVARLIQLRDENSYDATVVNGATVADLDPVAIREYRRTRLNRTADELQLTNRDLVIAVRASFRADVMGTRA